MFNIVVAVSKNGVIGNNNELPWNYREDMKFFKNITTSNNKKDIIIMGSNTWKSIGRKLPNRINIVLTRKTNKVMELRNNIYYSNNFDKLLERLEEEYSKYNIHVIGGQMIYEMALKHKKCGRIYYTKINKKVEGDRYFPKLYDNFKLINVKKAENKDLEFRVYEKVKGLHPEYQYLNHLKNIMNLDDVYEDRTGVGIKSTFGIRMEYDISKHIPLLTTKKVFSRIIIEELLWFLKGDTDNKLLQKKNVHIWDGNTSREFLDSLGHTNRREGDGGPIYGFNFRHYGAKYVDCDTDYTGQGYDQVKEVIRLIKEEPNSRRILINLWNPCVLKEGVLPPCFVKNTKVYTKYGYKNIQDINKEDKLKTHLGNFQEINQIHKTKYSGEIYNIKTKYIPNIECTPNHPFYAKKIELDKDNIILNETEPEWITANKLTNEHYMGIKLNNKSKIPEIKFNINNYNKIYNTIQYNQNNNRNDNQNEENILKLNDNNVLFLLGYYLRNGYLNKNDNNSFYIKFNKRNERINEEIIKRFSKNVISMRKLNEEDEIIYKMYSFNLRRILNEFEKEEMIIIPNYILDLPKELLKHFMKGYLINNNSIKSYDEVYKIQLILLKLKIVIDIKLNEKNEYNIELVQEDKLECLFEEKYVWFKIDDLKIKKKKRYLCI